MYNDLVEITSLISIVSIATERVVEIVKPMLPEFNAKYNTTNYSLMALGISLLILSVSDIPLSSMFSILPVQNVVLALACTAGSGFWNDILKALQTLKIK